MSPFEGTFVSFGGRARNDKDLARRLISRLQDLGFQPWIYERPGGGIALGADILDGCRAQIAQSRLFLSVLTESTLTSEIAAREVEHAIIQRVRMICIAAPTVQTCTWPAPWRALRGSRVLQLRGTNDADIEQAMVELCHTSSRLYQPPSEGVRRFPLVQKLSLALQGQAPSRPQIEIGSYVRLLTDASRCTEAYARGDLEGARRRIERIVDELEDEYPSHRFAYPLIAKAVLLFETHAQAQALRLFQEIAGWAEGEDRATALAGWAFMANEVGQSRQARELYRCACAASPVPEPDLYFNILLTSLLCEPYSPPSDWAPSLDGAEGEIVRHPDDHTRFEVMRALRELRCGHREKARRRIEGLEGSAIPLDLVGRLSDELRLHGLRFQLREPLEEAAALLARLQDALGGSELDRAFVISHRLARLRFELGETLSAEGEFRRLVARFPRYPQFMLEHALALKSLGRPAEAYRELRRACALTRFGECEPKPQEVDYHYYLGFARWLLGDVAVAASDFERSERRANDWYPQVLSRYGL